MGLVRSQTLNEIRFQSAAIVFTYTLLPEGWALVCNQTAQARPGSVHHYVEKLLHEFGNETRKQYSTAGIIKMLREINSTYKASHHSAYKTVSKVTIIITIPLSFSSILYF